MVTTMVYMQLLHVFNSMVVEVEVVVLEDDEEEDDDEEEEEEEEEEEVVVVVVVVVVVGCPSVGRPLVVLVIGSMKGATLLHVRTLMRSWAYSSLVLSR